jgi:hypothetical protein
VIFPRFRRYEAKAHKPCRIEIIAVILNLKMQGVPPESAGINVPYPRQLSLDATTVQRKIDFSCSSWLKKSSDFFENSELNSFALFIIQKSLVCIDAPIWSVLIQRQQDYTPTLPSSISGH